MPFDATAGSISFLTVSHRAGTTPAPVLTHWSFWSDQCELLLDETVCLAPDGNVVVDPTRVNGRISPRSPPVCA